MAESHPAKVESRLDELQRGIVRVQQVYPAHPSPVTLICPGCGSKGVFLPVASESHDAVVNAEYWLGQRICPDLACRTHVFVVAERGTHLVRSYPRQQPNFDPSGVPRPIAMSFAAALSCYAEGIHVAAAIMIRRTLEELCEDKAAEGGNLKDRIGALRAKVVLPAELFSALDDLRLLGNDAAHVQAKTYDTIGKLELEAAIELTKEILKAVYQLDGLLGRLRALKKP